MGKANIGGRCSFNTSEIRQGATSECGPASFPTSKGTARNFVRRNCVQSLFLTLDEAAAEVLASSL